MFLKHKKNVSHARNVHSFTIHWHFQCTIDTNKKTKKPHRMHTQQLKTTILPHIHDGNNNTDQPYDGPPQKWRSKKSDWLHVCDVMNRVETQSKLMDTLFFYFCIHTQILATIRISPNHFDTQTRSARVKSWHCLL